MITATATVYLPAPNSAQPRAVAVRALWAWEQDLAEEAFPRPMPPLKKDPNRGSAADPIPDPKDPLHQEELRRWVRDLARAQVFLATAEKPDDSLTADGLRSGVKAVARIYTADELDHLWLSLRKLSTLALVKEALRVVIVKREDQDAPTIPGGDALTIPESYDLTEDAILYRAACRAGQDPFAWVHGLSPQQRATALAHEIVMRREEDAKLAVLRSAVGILGG